MAGEYDINLSNGSVLATLFPLEVNGPDNLSTPRQILRARPQFEIVQVGSLAPNGVLKITGDATGIFVAGLNFDVVLSPANNGSYTVQSSTYNSTQNETDITLTGTLPDPNPGGLITLNCLFLQGDISSRFVGGFTFDVQNSSIYDGTYTVGGPTANSYYSGNVTVVSVVQNLDPSLFSGSFTSNDTLPPPLGQIQYSNSDARTTLKLPGSGILNYGEMIIENLVRMTENFADTVSPDTNANIGTSPSGQPLTGQLWFNTSDNAFRVWDGSNWVTITNVANGTLTFTDVEDGNKTIHITAAETNLPAPWPGGGEPGLVVWNESNPPDDEPVFRVLAQAGDELLRVEYNSTPNAGYTRTLNNLEVQGTGESAIHGPLRIGDAAGLGGTVYVDADSGQTALIDFETNNVSQGTISVADGPTPTLDINAVNAIQLDGTTLYVDTVANSVGIGGAPSFGFDVVPNARFQGYVGINNPPPSGTTRLEVTGDIQVNSQIKASDQTTAAPAYSFTNHTDSGMWYDGGVNELCFAVQGTTFFCIGSNGIDVSRESDATQRTHITLSRGTFNVGTIETQSDIGGNVTGVVVSTTGGDNVVFNNDQTTTFQQLVNVDPTLNYETLVTDDDDIPNKKYVDDTVGNISWREPVRVVDENTYANSSAFPTTGVVDTVTLNVGDRVLFRDVTAAIDRDIFIWNGSGWDRDDDPNARTVGDTVYVSEGTDNNKILIYDINGDWVEISGTGGFGAGINPVREEFTASAGQTTFTLANTYKPTPNGDRLLVFVNGQKMIKDLFYTEAGVNQVDIIPPSPFIGGETVEFYTLADVETNEATFVRELQTVTINGQTTFNLNLLSYTPGSNNLFVYRNGQKAVIGVDYTEVSTTQVSWIGNILSAGETLEFYASVPVIGGKTLGALSNVVNGVDTATTDDVLAFDGTAWTAVTPATFAADIELNDIGDVNVPSPTNGDVLTYSSGNWQPTPGAAQGALQTVQIFDTAGIFTYTKPAGLARVKVEVLGAGGAGGGAPNPVANSTSAGGGGGAGAYTVALIEAGDIGATETITVGAGGTGINGGAGNDGGDSSFGSHVIAGGGSGGNTRLQSGGDGSNAAPGNGGVATINTGVGISGVAGADGDAGVSTGILFNGVSGFAHGGEGADTIYGSGGRGRFEFGAPPEQNGSPAQGYGAGGGGGVAVEDNQGGQGPAFGGNGAPGLVVVWEYYN